MIIQGFGGWHVDDSIYDGALVPKFGGRFIFKMEEGSPFDFPVNYIDNDSPEDYS